MNSGNSRVFLRSVTLAIWSLAAVASLAADQAPPLALTFDTSAVVVSGVTHGGDVAIFGSTIEPMTFYKVYSHRERFLHDDGGAGSVRFELGKPVPPSSIWIAVDIATGQYVSGTPDPSRTHPLPLSKSVIKKKTDIDTLDLPFEPADVAFVRPGVGVWEFSKHDVPQDDKGRTLLSLDQAVFVGSTQKLSPHLENQDVIVILDPLGLGYYVARVNQ